MAQANNSDKDKNEKEIGVESDKYEAVVIQIESENKILTETDKTDQTSNVYNSNQPKKKETYGSYMGYYVGASAGGAIIPAVFGSLVPMLFESFIGTLVVFFGSFPVAIGIGLIIGHCTWSEEPNSSEVKTQDTDTDKEDEKSQDPSDQEQTEDMKESDKKDQKDQDPVEL
jgi:hypothetical protein